MRIIGAFCGVVLLVFSCRFLQAQTAGKQYQGLMWQISGNGMKEPSFLYGTMHVSNKVAFHLGEPFFKALQNVDEVCLEVDPDTWLSEHVDADDFNNTFSTNFFFSDYSVNDPFERNLEIKRDQKQIIKDELSDDPAIINTFMFRSDKIKADFQEDTYLDLYIYQTARKFGKNVFGLESVAELDKSQDNAARAKAYEDWSITKKGRSKLNALEGAQKLEDAYRRGDLDELDSISALLSSDSTREHILFRRNVVMVDRMVKTMKDHSLFAGMGAGHLPGTRGVIELLRSKGYTVTPVEVGDRDAETRERVERMIVPRVFTPFTPPDSIFTVEVPDKMFAVKERAAQQNYLCADMINGTYFTVSRIKSYAAYQQLSPERILKMVDSLLYENVPGKIIEQKNIMRDGVPGIYILNKTKKGSNQAYNIYTTPDEIIIFKVSGNEYTSIDEYGIRFLQSIHFNLNKDDRWHLYTAPNKSFSIQLPGKPLSYQQHDIYSMSKVDLISADPATGNSYYICRTTISNPDYLEEDTFELSLMAYQFGRKNNFKETARQWSEKDKRQVLFVSYTAPDSQNVKAMFVIQNLHYYALAAFYRNDSSKHTTFFESLKFALPVYPNYKEHRDTILHFTAELPYNYRVSQAAKTFSYGTLNSNPYKPISRAHAYSPPGSHEVVEVAYYQYSPFYQDKDTSDYLSRRRIKQTYNKDFVVKQELVSQTGSTLMTDYIFCDTNSTRQIHERTILKNGVRYILTSFQDTLLGESEFVTRFFSTFSPADTIIGSSLFTDHSGYFLDAILSADSMTRLHAIEQKNEAAFNASSADALMRGIHSIPLCSDYAAIREILLEKFSGIPSHYAIDFLQREYAEAGDTAQFQFAILQALGKMQCTDAVVVARRLLAEETPLSDESSDVYDAIGTFYDSLQISKLLFPQLLDLITIEEYKAEVYSLLAYLLDSGYVKPAVYKSAKGIILSEARLELKRENGSRREAGGNDYKNDYKLRNYAALLLPFYKDPKVKAVFDKLLTSRAPFLRMHAAIRLQKAGISVADSVWINLARDKEYRTELHYQLERNKLLQFYPNEYKTQTSFNESIIHSYIGTETNPVDTFALLMKVPGVTYRGKTGTVYLYKYKVKKDKDWKLALMGLQPDNDQMVDGKYTLLDLKSEYLDNSKTPAEQLQDLIIKRRKKKTRDT